LLGIGRHQVNQAAIIENKHLDAVSMLARSIQEAMPGRKRNYTEPSPRSHGAYLFPSPVSPPFTDHPCKRGRPRLKRPSPIEAVQQAQWVRETHRHRPRLSRGCAARERIAPPSHGSTKE
jgi:hypothetical protein